jgi:hypothetical protein
LRLILALHFTFFLRVATRAATPSASNGLAKEAVEAVEAVWPGRTYHRTVVNKREFNDFDHF